MNDQDTAQPMVKGAAMLGFLKFIKDQPPRGPLAGLHGNERLEKVVSSLSPQVESIYSRKVIAVADYPYAAFVELIRAVDTVMGKGDLQLCRTLGEYAASRDLRSFMETFKRKIKPEEIFGSIDIIWHSYHINSGDVKMEDTSPDHSVICIYKFPQMDPAHCRLMEGYFNQGLIETGLEIIESVKEVKCTSKGDAHHEFLCHWRMPA